MISNKKGFTLVELLVVIVVLGLLILLAMPSVLDAMESSSKNIFASQVLAFSKDVKTTFEQVKSEKGSATPICYNVQGLKEGTQYGGYILVDYVTGDISSIQVYNQEYYYGGTYANIADKKGKATFKLIPTQHATSQTAATSVITSFGSTSPTVLNCPKPEDAIK